MTPLVFLHGFLGTPAEWRPVLDALSPQQLTSAIQLPLAADWSAGVRRIGAELPEQCVLVGYSLGARVALGVALADPVRIRGLCLVSGNPGLPPDQCAKRFDHDRGVALRIESQAWPEFLRDWYQQDVFASVDQQARATWIRQKAALDRPYQANLLRCYSIANQPNYWPQLNGLPFPTLVIVGERDPKYMAIAQAIQQCAPRIQVSVVPASGHAVHRERPGAVANLLTTFCASISERETGGDQDE